MATWWVVKKATWWGAMNHLRCVAAWCGVHDPSLGRDGDLEARREECVETQDQVVVAAEEIAHSLDDTW